MDWFLNDNGLRHERVKLFDVAEIPICYPTQKASHSYRKQLLLLLLQ